MSSVLMVILLVAVIALMVWLRIIIPNIKGKMGEFNVSVVLATLPKEEYQVINDIIIPSKYGTTQIDHVVVSIYGIFVIETKNYKGLIYGGEDAETWTKNMWGNKYSLRNPLKQNYGHVKSLQAILNIPKEMFIPIVVFSNRAKLRVQTQEAVINLWRLRSEIKKHKTPIIPSEQLIDYRSSIELAAIDDKDIAKSHKANVRQNLNQRSQAIANGLCPRCGGHLVKRNGRYGSFYGCSNYPNCKFTMKS